MEIAKGKIKEIIINKHNNKIMNVDFGYMCNEFGRCHIAIFILKQLTLEKYGLDSIRANRIYDKRYIYDMEGLDKMNYIIIYPYDRK